MIGSNTDSTKEITLLAETATNLGASDTQIQEALRNSEGSNTDSRKAIGLLMLIASLVTSGGSGGEFTVEDRAKLNSIPTKVGQLTNDSGFITKAVSDLTNYYKKSETYTQAEINAKISAIPKFDISVVATLPTSNISATTIYLLKSGEESSNLYTEYIYADNKWEILGRQTVDLSGYALKSEIPVTLASLTQDSTHRTVTDTEKETWTNKSNFSGKYTDLTDIPTDLVKSSAITLGTHTDGLVYIFINGEPVGTGITVTTPTT